MFHLSYDQIVATLTSQGERYAKYRSRMAEGECGDWQIKKFTVEINFANLRMVRDGRGCSPGIFTKLTRKGHTIMSDTDAEIEDFLPFVRVAKGQILVAGLGLGLVTQCLLDSPNVDHITVIEIDPDVVSLAGVQLDDRRLTIETADVFAWKPRNQKFDFGWYDIWDDICADNLPQMTKLKKKFGRCVGRHRAWCESECRRLA